MVLLGLFFVLAALAALIKGYEIRLVFLSLGIVMGLLSGRVLDAINATSLALVANETILIVCSVLGYYYVMQTTGCNMALSLLCAKGLQALKVVLLPIVVLLTFAINILIPSAISCTLLVGVIVIPLLISVGIKRNFAAVAVVAGSWGSVLNLTSDHNMFIAKLANVDSEAVVRGHLGVALLGVLIVAVLVKVLELISKHYFQKQEDGYEVEVEGPLILEQEQKYNLIYALAPLLPLGLMLLSSSQVGLISSLTVLQAIIISFCVGMMTFNPEELSITFFLGMGKAFGKVATIILVAAVFVEGIELMGITAALVEVFRTNISIIRVTAAYGPIVFAFLTGSGDLASLAFNATVTPFAGQLGYSITSIGSVAYLSGALGRIISPLSGVVIVCAHLANVRVLEIVKINMIIILFVSILNVVILL